MAQKSDALVFLRTTDSVWDLVFLDPPYGSSLLQSALSLLPDRLSENAMVYCETAAPFEPPPGFGVHKYSRVGGNHLTLLTPASRQ